MKYFTKEWYEAMQNTDYHRDLKVSKKAESFSEEYFKKLYKKEETTWLKERKDETKENFKELFRFKIKDLKSNLPNEIIQKVADIRVLALKYVSSDIRREIVKFSIANYEILESAQKGYSDENPRKLFTPEEINFFENSFHDCIVKSCRKKGKNLIISLDNSGGFTGIDHVILKNYTVLKQDKRLHGSWWLYNEIYKTDTGYEIHVLLQSGGRLIDFIISTTAVEYKYDKLKFSAKSTISSIIRREIRRLAINDRKKSYTTSIQKEGYLTCCHDLYYPNVPIEDVTFSDADCKSFEECFQRTIDAAVLQYHKKVEYRKNHAGESFIETINTYDDPSNSYRGTLRLNYDSGEIFGVLIKLDKNNAHEYMENRYLEVNFLNFENTEKLRPSYAKGRNKG